MSDLSHVKSILLGAIQGLTEFLPISSSAHLAIAQDRLGLAGDSVNMLLLDVMVHIATVASILIVFARPCLQFLIRLRAELSTSWTGRRHALRVAGLALVATIPTAAIGLGFQKQLEDSFGRPAQVAVELAVTGVLLMTLRWVPRGRRGWGRFRGWHAAVVGVAQGIAILPGISRSGSTICAATYLGLRRRWAAEFSFLIAMPAILGGAFIKGLDTLRLPSEQLDALPWGPIFSGSVVALVVGVISLKLLVAAVRKAKLHWFAPYCWGVAAIVLWQELS